MDAVVSQPNSKARKILMGNGEGKGKDYISDRSTERFFSGCPILENMIAFWNCTKRVTISIPSVKALTIDGGPCFPNYLLESVVAFYEENLISVQYTNFVPVELFLCDLFSLTNAYTDVTSLGHTESEIAQRATGLLHGIHSVKSLTLSTETREKLQDCLPKFLELTHLKVIPGMPETNKKVFKCFLENSPTVPNQCIFTSISTQPFPNVTRQE
ncbi:hypothetical protein Pint_04898 [Pistacia integerrima]|uniref:Uncharacterized protein n=1 Tax=Pistacia integerrima TaxID=434235 RepID=A0ACC0Z871_9ROSI|nr:hypothetical protein Pint_04898 [Pistacia integerrima]